MLLSLWIILVVTASLALAYRNAPGWHWTAAGAVVLLAGLGAWAIPIKAFLVLAAIFAAVKRIVGHILQLCLDENLERGNFRFEL